MQPSQNTDVFPAEMNGLSIQNLTSADAPQPYAGFHNCYWEAAFCYFLVDFSVRLQQVYKSLKFE